jgi:hypothetical protein
MLLTVKGKAPVSLSTFSLATPGGTPPPARTKSGLDVWLRVGYELSLFMPYFSSLKTELI